MLFNPSAPVFCPRRATLPPDTLPTRARLLAGLGVDFTLALPFDAELAACPASQFIDTILINALSISGVSVGHDFHFGKATNTGHADSARGEAGFEVFVTPALLQADSEALFVICHSPALRDGDVRAAATHGP